MPLVLVVLLAAVGLGRLLGGRLERLGRLPLRSRSLVVAAGLAQIAGALVGGAAYPAGLAASALLAGAFLARNRGVAGIGLVGLGLAANALVVAANGAMPVSAPAAERAGAPIGAVLVGEDPRHELLDEGTRLPWLADVVPVPLPGAPHVVSAGDVLVAAGLGQLVLVGMRTGRPRSAPSGAGGGSRPGRPPAGAGGR